MRALIAVCLAAAGFGFFLGRQGLFPFTAAAKSATSTPLARVGYVLQAEQLQATPAAWAELRGDVEAVRSTLKEPERDVFDLVAAVRGLNNGGEAEWLKAEQLCRGLRWPRCDRSALEELRRRSRP